MWIYPLQLIRSNTQIDFNKWARYAFFFSLCAIIIGCVFIYVKGFNFGLDFVGGTQLEIRSNKSIPLEQVRKTLCDLKLGEISLQSQGQESRELLIKVSSDSRKDYEILKGAINKVLLGHDLQYLSINFIGPQVNEYLINSGLKAIMFAVAGVVFYTWIRFSLSFGLGILFILFHNLILCFAFMSICTIDFNQSTVAALLIIVGYCVNDSIVIYDKILFNAKNLKNLNKDVVNLSVNRTLSRTILTSLTTLIANLALILFGGKAILSFSVLVFVGICVGTYSSIIFSGPIVLYLNRKSVVKEQLSTE